MLLFNDGVSLTLLVDIKTSALQPGKVSCTYCIAHSRTPWFLAKNVWHHINRPSHTKAAAEAKVKQETKVIVDRLRGESVQRLQESGRRYAQISSSQQLEIPALTVPAPKVDEQQMWDEFESDQSKASLLNTNAASQFNPAQQREVDFNRALDRAEVNGSTEWGFDDFGMECDVDETLTNVMQNLGKSGEISCSRIQRTYNLIRPQ